MIEFVFLDLDDTLFDFEKSERFSLTSMLNDFGYKPTDREIKRYSEINLAHWKKLERGELTHEQVKVNRYEVFFKEIGLNRSGVEGTRRYEEYLKQTYFFVDGAEKLLDNLKGKYRLFIVSNGLKKDQEGRINKAGISHYFELIFNSEELGASKPDKKFFDYCFDKIKGFDLKKAVIVGDSLTSDIKGGINAGIKTIWFNKRKEINDGIIKPDYTIDSLDELTDILEKM